MHHADRQTPETCDAVDGRRPRPASALWYVAPQRAEHREVPLPQCAPGFAEVRTQWSGLSRGTERLVFEGRVPVSEWTRMRCPNQEGAFPFPVKYGYAAVGIVEAGPAALIGRTVFALHPHQSRFVLPVDHLMPLPDTVPARRAVLAANMETALNAMWDSGTGPADRMVVIGAGLIGCLVAALAARMPGAEVTLVDINPRRADIARHLGCRFALPYDAPIDADVVFHASATAAGLASALRCAGFEARVIELSWYGESEIAVPLGGAFHSQRLQVISSQVGAVNGARRSRWPHGRRLAAALALLADDRLDALISDEVAFDALPVTLPHLLAANTDCLAAAVRY